MAVEHLDVLIVGAGLSGICAAYYVQKRLPTKSYAILEGRAESGGTWDLFRYPGVRSDSDMHTLGYSFRPWRGGKAIADGPTILHYLRETAAAFGIDRKIRYGHRVRRASWSSEEQRWTVAVQLGASLGASHGASGETRLLTCGFLLMCSGYYEYEHGYTPEWPGRAGFRGLIVHPQEWPADLDYAGKRVVVIGSGATAVTLVPALAREAAHVTMLQRSPTYIVAQPSRDAIADALFRRLPSSLAHSIVRGKNIAFGMLFYSLARRRPARVRQSILKATREQLGPDYDVERDFSPTYDPWDQRLCLAPDGDLFEAMRRGKAAVVTDQIETFSEAGLRLRSGVELPADVVVTATGLNIRLLGGVELTVDGEPVDLSKALSYRGTMFGGVPNLVSVFGYINASWTLKCELIVQYATRLLGYMDRHGYGECRPSPLDATSSGEPVIGLTSGYVRRALGSLPRQGKRAPWRTYQNYARDVLYLRLARIDDGAMRFVERRARAAEPAPVGPAPSPAVRYTVPRLERLERGAHMEKHEKHADGLNQADLAYQDPTRRIEERVADLVSRMTVEEKISQMVTRRPGDRASGHSRLQLVERVPPRGRPGGDCDGLPPGNRARGDLGRGPRSIEWPTSHLRRGPRQTPRVRSAAADASIYQGLTFWSPNINLFRDPRWGRGQETYGEDPYLTGPGSASPSSVASRETTRSYSEDGRHRQALRGPQRPRVGAPRASTLGVSERDLARPTSRRSRPASREGEAYIGHGRLQPRRRRGLLRQHELLLANPSRGVGLRRLRGLRLLGHRRHLPAYRLVGYDGRGGGRRALKAGIDLDCGSQSTHTSCEAVEKGLIDEDDDRQALERLFSARFRLGMFDPPRSACPSPGFPIAETRHARSTGALALADERESIVLLKNDGTFPLSKRPRVGRGRRAERGRRLACCSATTTARRPVR